MRDEQKISVKAFGITNTVSSNLIHNVNISDPNGKKYFVIIK